MDAADESWSIADPVADAGAKINALSTHAQRLQESLQALDAETQAQVSEVNGRTEQAVGAIRKQIADLEALVARELERAAKETAALEGTLSAAKAQTALELSEIQKTREQLQRLATNEALLPQRPKDNGMVTLTCLQRADRPGRYRCCCFCDMAPCAKMTRSRNGQERPQATTESAAPPAAPSAARKRCGSRRRQRQNCPTAPVIEPPKTPPSSSPAVEPPSTPPAVSPKAEPVKTGTENHLSPAESSERGESSGYGNYADAARRYLEQAVNGGDEQLPASRRTT